MTAVESITVLSGTFHMGLGDKLDAQKSMPLGVGHMMILKHKTPHFAWIQEETEIQLHGSGPWGITYVNPADDIRGRNRASGCRAVCPACA